MNFFHVFPADWYGDVTYACQIGEITCCMGANAGELRGSLAATWEQVGPEELFGASELNPFRHSMGVKRYAGRCTYPQCNGQAHLYVVTWGISSIPALPVDPAAIGLHKNQGIITATYGGSSATLLEVHRVDL